jgi:hypothetical protein
VTAPVCAPTAPPICPDTLPSIPPAGFESNAPLGWRAESGALDGTAVALTGTAGFASDPVDGDAALPTSVFEATVLVDAGLEPDPVAEVLRSADSLARVVVEESLAPDPLLVAFEPDSL